MFPRHVRWTSQGTSRRRRPDTVVRAETQSPRTDGRGNARRQPDAGLSGPKVVSQPTVDASVRVNARFTGTFWSRRRRTRRVDTGVVDRAGPRGRNHTREEGQRRTHRVVGVTRAEGGVPADRRCLGRGQGTRVCAPEFDPVELQGSAVLKRRFPSIRDKRAEAGCRRLSVAARGCSNAFADRRDGGARRACRPRGTASGFRA